MCVSFILYSLVGKAGSNSNTAYDGLWKAHIKGTLPGGGAGEPSARPPIPPGGYGASLSPADVDGIAKFLEEFTVRMLLPYLEVRVRNLNHQVSHKPYQNCILISNSLGLFAPFFSQLRLYVATYCSQLLLTCFTAQKMCANADAHQHTADFFIISGHNYVNGLAQPSYHHM